MQDGTSVTKSLGELDTTSEVKVRLYYGAIANAQFKLEFRHEGLGIDYHIWLSRDQLHIVSDLLVEALEEDDGSEKG